MKMRADAKLKLQIAGELRDSIDMFTHTPADYAKFLAKLMPVFTSILSGQPVFISTSPEQVCRPSWAHLGHYS
jgi:transformation/transcription domain-associated protein